MCFIFGGDQESGGRGKRREEVKENDGGREEGGKKGQEGWEEGGGGKEGEEGWALMCFRCSNILPQISLLPPPTLSEHWTPCLLS
jgi:hypothetical protein